MKGWIVAVVLAGVLIWGYTHHVQGMGKLEGEIAARGDAIKQLSQVAAQKRQAFQGARSMYLAKPSLESCSVVLSSCEAMHQADSSQIILLTKQIDAQKKLRSKNTFLGFLPRPSVQVGVCANQHGVGPGLSGGFPVTH